MYDSEIIVISGDESDDSAVEILYDSTSAPEKKCSVNRTNVRSSISTNGSENKNQLRELVDDDGFVNDNDHYLLMQELTNVLDSCKTSLMDQNSCSSTSDIYVIPEIIEEDVVKSNLNNKSSVGSGIQILNVESLNHRINLWIDCKQKEYVPPDDDGGQEEFEGGFKKFVASNDLHEFSNSEVPAQNEFLELEYGNSETSFSSQNNLWVKTQIDRQELKVLNKYLPVVKLTRVSCPKNNTDSDDLNKMQIQVGNPNDNKDYLKPSIYTNIVKKEQKVGTELPERKDNNQGILDFSCEICVKTFHSKDSFQKHIKYRHTGDKSYKCNQCDYASNAYMSLQNHLWTHTSERPYQCRCCKFASVTAQSLRDHVRRIHTKERPFMCPHPPCTLGFATSQSLKNHTKNKHTIKECTICNFKTITLRNFNDHRRSCHGDNVPYACSECNYCSPNGKDLEVHKKTHFTQKMYPCSYCTFSTQYKNGFECHLSFHKDINFKCEVCSVKYTSQDTLNKHKLNYHTVLPSNQVVKCSFCQETFNNKYNMTLHVKTHKYPNLRKCNECLYTTFSERQFQKHICDHKHNKLFICDDCSKSYLKKKLLKRHKLYFHCVDIN